MRKMKTARTGLLKSESGFTLVEVLSVTLIMGFLIASAAIGFSVFFSKFRELSRWAELQSEAFESLQQIKNGILVGSGENTRFLGVSSANRLELVASGIGGIQGGYKLICYHPAQLNLIQGQIDVTLEDRVEFWYDRRAIRATTRIYGMPSSNAAYLFPPQEKTDYMEVTKFIISAGEIVGGEVKSVKIELSARVETGKKRYRYVNYSTIMALRFP